MAYQIWVPRQWCEPSSLPRPSASSDTYILLNDPTTATTINFPPGPIVKPRHLHHIVFDSSTPGSLALTVGYFSGQGDARSGCPFKLSHNDPVFKNYIIDTAARFEIFRNNTKPPAEVFVAFAKAVGIPREFGIGVYRDVSVRVAGAVDRFGKLGVSEFSVLTGPGGRKVGWKTTIDSAVRLLTKSGAFDHGHDGGLAGSRQARVEVPASSQLLLPSPAVGLFSPTAPLTSRVRFEANSPSPSSVDMVRGHEERVNGHDARFDSHGHQLERHEGRINNLDSDVSSLKDTDQTLAANISKVSYKVSSLGSDMSGLKSVYQTQAGDISKVSSKVLSLGSDISGLKAADQTLASSISNVSSKVASLDSNISGLKSGDQAMSLNISTLNSKVSSLESSDQIKSSELSSFNSEVSTLNSKVTSHDANLTNHETKISTLRSQIHALASPLTTTTSDISTLQSTNHLLATSMSHLNDKLSTHSAQSSAQVAEGNEEVRKLEAALGPTVEANAKGILKLADRAERSDGWVKGLAERVAGFPTWIVEEV